MDTFTIVEIVTQIITLFMISSGIPPCMHMVKTKSTKGIPYTFFILGLLNALGGLWYGFLLDVAGIKFINTVSTVVNIGFIIAYLIVEKIKSQALVKLLIGVSLVAAVWFYLIYFIQNAEAITTQLGRLLFFQTLFLLAAPLLEVVEIVQDQTSEHMSRSMLLGGFLCCSAWLIYGSMLGDFNIYAPNYLGITVVLLKFSLIFIYPGGKKERVV